MDTQIQVWEANADRKGTRGLSRYQGFNKPQNASLSLLKDKDSSPPFKAKRLRPGTLAIGIFRAKSLNILIPFRSGSVKYLKRLYLRFKC